ncbi:hypothetical protein NBO_10g0016 [Nosema bombycis CQ1]|uniref:Uncharacterized protein n=1 Tax=Nosema bombycis (strain CQ1 / CVCC 102059) TaxID=578461 RepID=R0KVU5_NOSB1|nr:hypothetical protein NBO_10g0016 [Nosema bombycis CQ1]|eukprot:EOB15026.1 hypothetical protein NBO_10g0016 [Nosema bombycis CQ1]
MTLFTTSSKRISENLKVLEQYCEDYNKLIRCVNTSVLDKNEENLTSKKHRRSLIVKC